MEMERLEQELRDFFAVEVNQTEPPTEWWNNIITGLEDRKRASFWKKFVPRTRLAWALVLVALLVIGGSAYAATSLVGKLFHTLAPDIGEAGLIVDLNLSQTIDGVTVRLEQGYADSNMILIGYTVTGRNARYSVDGRKLSLSDGLDIPDRGGLGRAPMNLLNWQPSEVTAVAVFDGSVVEGAPTELNLTFETTVGNSPSIALSSNTWGPFTFNFTLPFHRAKEIIVNQTSEVAGIPVTLEKVIISPSATGAIFRFYGEYEDNRKRPLPISILQPAVSTAEGMMPETVHASSTYFPEEYTLDTYPGDFTKRTGEWTITIDELVFPPRRQPGQTGDFSGTASDTKRVSGPWIFTFEVP
jgi:hypothetical protein